MKVRSTFFVSMIIVTVAFSADDWTQMFPPNPIPEARHAHAMAYIGEDRILLFGGQRGVPYDNETWLYYLSDNTWTDLNPSGNVPDERKFHDMAYIGDDQVFLYGGVNNSGGFGDFWIYDLSDNTWTQIFPLTGSPGVRYGHAMCYIGDDQIFIYGGHDYYSVYLNDSWIYDLSDNTWTNVSPGGDSPPGNFHHDIARIDDGKVLHFGGYVGTDYSDETWLYDCATSTWTNLDPIGTIPDDRWFPAMAYLTDDQVVMYGGEEYYSLFDDTWVYDLSENCWTLDDNTIIPGSNSRHRMCETSLDGSSYPVMFGGWLNGNDDNETWTFGGGDYLGIAFPIRQGSAPIKYTLSQNYPNPFNPTTTISFDLPVASQVDLQVFDINGRNVGARRASPFSPPHQYQPGTHSIAFDGSGLSSGIYIYRLTAGEFVGTGKMVLMK